MSIICVGDRKERVSCLPSWEEDIVRIHFVINKSFYRGDKKYQHVYRLFITLYIYDIFSFLSPTQNMYNNFYKQYP